jgi:hypothetical protein
MFSAKLREMSRSRTVLLGIVALAAVSLLLFCSKPKEASEGGAVQVARDKVQSAVLRDVTVTGKLGCGHCTFSLEGLGQCAVAIKTEDGKFYVIEGAPNQDDLFEQRFSGDTVTVVGQLTPGEKYGVIRAKSVTVE